MNVDRPSALRLFVDPARDGVTNMALDGVLLEAASAEAAGALRLYRWRPATLSLGYFQRYDDDARRADGDLASLPVVRRCTGGGAIVHADELTYSLALPLDHPLAGSRPGDLYHWMHARVAAAVAGLGGRTNLRGGQDCLSARGGPFLCFACHASFDLMAGADKLAGSAQRRTRTGLLQHGSVVLRRTHPAQPSAAVSDLAGRTIGFDELADALMSAVRKAGVTLTDAVTTDPSGPAFDAQHELHRSAAWIQRV